MKLTVHMDQRAAVRAGIDAPNSTARVEFIPEQVGDPDILRLVGDHIDFRSGELAIPGVDSKPLLTFTRPPTHFELIGQLRRVMWRWATAPNAPAELKHRHDDALRATHDVLNGRVTRPKGGRVHVRRLNGTLDRWEGSRPDAEGPDEVVATVEIEALEPDWPADALDDIVNSAEAEAWEAELESANQEAIARAFAEAERQLEALEKNLAQIREKEAEETAKQQERADALRQRLVEAIEKDGAALAKERLKRGWLSLEGLIEAALQPALANLSHRPVEFFPRLDTAAVAAQDDVEMQAILDLETELMGAGMSNVSVEMARLTEHRFTERWLRGHFDCAALELERVRVDFAFERKKAKPTPKELPAFAAELKSFRESHGLSPEQASKKLGVSAEHVIEIEAGRRDAGEALQELVGILKKTPPKR